MGPALQGLMDALPRVYEEDEAQQDAVKTVPPPPSGDAYSAATRVGAVPAAILADLADLASMIDGEVAGSGVRALVSEPAPPAAGASAAHREPLDRSPWRDTGIVATAKTLPSRAMDVSLETGPARVSTGLAPTSSVEKPSERANETVSSSRFGIVVVACVVMALWAVLRFL